MRVAGQVCFRGCCFRIEQGAHALDQIEIEIANAAGLQPFVNGSALQGPRLGAETGCIQMLGFGLL